MAQSKRWVSTPIVIMAGGIAQVIELQELAFFHIFKTNQLPQTDSLRWDQISREKNLIRLHPSVSC